MTITNIGRYQVKSEIARGGMATVYHAYDPRFERDVAIKILPEVFLHDPQFRTRFDREAKMIALLEHPAIVPVYDFGEEGGQPYIVMRYMSGGSLNDRLRQGRMSLNETAKMISRIAPSLDAAHARNIIHRDLKPGNILFDQYGNGYLSDFGIARLTEESGMTLTGSAILGTPAYMSPEQVQGDKNLDGRSDVYALGVLVYQMLTGQVPYQADTPAKVMMMHILQPVPDITQERPDLPPDCQALISKAMAKNPDDRYATASELAAALESIAQGMPLPASATPDSQTVISRGRVRDAQMATTVSPGKTVVTPAKTVMAAGGGGAAVAPPGAIPGGEAALPKPRSPLAIAIPVVIVLVLLVGAGIVLAFMGTQGNGPLAFLAPPPPTATSTPTLPPPTDTPETGVGSPGTLATPTQGEPTQIPTDTAAPPTPTETAEPTPASLAIGGADKMAYFRDSEVWVVNLDGTEDTQLTNDQATKTFLTWTPDGQGVHFISGKCVYTVFLADKRIELVACFTFADYNKIFEISPDGKQVALSIDNQLYIVPYDLEQLKKIEVRADVAKMATCQHFGPYLKNFVKAVRWSEDGSQLAMIIMGVAANLGSADIIQVIPFTECIPNPKAIDNFPPPRFTPPEYVAGPSVPSFSWDGRFLFALNTVVRNNLYGNLYVYNMDLKKAGNPINPANGDCCYISPVWSPDKTHILVAFQKYPGGDGSIVFYYFPYATVGTGVTYTPLPIQPLLNPKENPQPALRPVLRP